jgi:transposase-like protein
MKSKDFDALTAQLELLTAQQRQMLVDRLGMVKKVKAVNALIEDRLLAAPICPKCAHTQVAPWGSASGLQRYRCAACKATFNALTGTALARLRKKDKWLEYATQMEQGQSVRKSAVACDVHRNTAFRWRHRFLAGLNTDKPAALVGIAEADETFFRNSLKGQKQAMPRPARKRGGKAPLRAATDMSDEHVPVLICRDRSGTTTDFVLRRNKKVHVIQALKPILAADVILCTDSSRMLLGAARELGVTHRPVNLAAGKRVLKQVYHVQNVNAYDSRLKTWMRRFNGVATCYLPNYLGWRRYLDRTSHHPSANNFLATSLLSRVDQQLKVT